MVITEIDGDVAAYDPHGEQVVVLNETASAIWRLCDGSRTLDELVVLLAAGYHVDPDVIREEGGGGGPPTERRRIPVVWSDHGEPPASTGR